MSQFHAYQITLAKTMSAE